MFGRNPKRPPEPGDGQRLLVQSIFPTLQGEGPYVGWPSVFLRLGGCNLACDFCDTEFESFNARRLDAVMDDVKNQAGTSRRLVVITGGEPFRQNIAPLCERLLAEGFRVQIETNGTLFRTIPDAVDIVCSPKPGPQGYAPLRPDLLARTGALKFVISETHVHYQDVGNVGQSAFSPCIYVQPMDEYDEIRNRANLARCVMLAGREGYVLSLQTHKIIGVE